jgi:sugar/nucleoside kinase (ribokinase family)
MYDICCIGHITLDKIVTPYRVTHLPGGTAFYFSHAIGNLPLRYHLATALAEKEMDILSSLHARGITITASPSRHTVYFENIYTGNQDHREQKVAQQADAFTLEQVTGLHARIYHLGPLLSGDIPVSVIKTLAGKGIVSLDAQGYLRNVRDEKVYPVDWSDKKEALPYISILKLNETEMEAITGHTHIPSAARELWNWGAHEIVITLGSNGSVICKDGSFTSIPAYQPTAVIDATGCGDTYMAGYLYMRVKEAALEDAGRFAAAMATLKIEASGPFTGNESDVWNVLSGFAYPIP